MENRLKERFGYHTDDIIEFMKNNDIVISGSFALQVYLNERWDNSDIDFYYNMKEHKKDEWIKEDVLNNNIIKLINIFKKIFNDSYNYLYDFTSNQCIKFYNNDDSTTLDKKHGIDLIISDNYKKVINEFDLSFNKIYWNPNSGFVLINPEEKKLIKKKMGYIANYKKNKLLNSLERYNKYKNRGFEIYCLNKNFSKDNFKNYCYNYYYPIENKLVKKSKKEFIYLLNNYCIGKELKKSLLNNDKIYYSIYNNELFICIFKIGSSFIDSKDPNGHKFLYSNLTFTNSVFDLRCDFCAYNYRFTKKKII